MAEERDVVAFLKDHKGQASLDQVSEGLRVLKYGPNSAYALLQSLRSKDLVDRKGEMWVLLASEAATPNEAASPEKKEPEVAPEVEKVMRAMAKTLAETLRGARAPADEWELAAKPMKTEIERREEKLGGLVLRPDEAPEAKKPLMGLETGTFLDSLFLTPEGETLNGIPICGQFAITGLPGAGKSVLVEEVAVRVAAADKKVLFATAEDTWKSASPRFDLQSRMKQKAEILGVDWNRIRKNLYVLDTVMYSELRDWSTFAETYRFVAEREGVDLAIVDSVTVLEAYRGALKYRVMELARYNQLHGITGLYVNQRSAERWDSYDMAGGIGLAHNLDGTVIVDYGHVYYPDQQVDLDAKFREFVRIARVLDCRMCNFERRRIRIDITSDGFIRALEPIPKPPS